MWCALALPPQKPHGGLPLTRAKTSWQPWRASPRGRCWLPELRFSLLFSTARPSRSGEKLVFYKLVRAAVSCRTKQIRNDSSRDQRAVKTNFAACQDAAPPGHHLWSASGQGFSTANEFDGNSVERSRPFTPPGRIFATGRRIRR